MQERIHWRRRLRVGEALVARGRHVGQLRDARLRTLDVVLAVHAQRVDLVRTRIHVSVELRALVLVHCSSLDRVRDPRQ